MFILFAVLLFQNLAAQELNNTKIKVDYKGKSLDLVLLDLKINYRLQFDYDEADIAGIEISQYFKKLPVRDAMKTILSGTGLAFKIIPPRTIQIYEGEQQNEAIISAATMQPEKTNFNINGTIKDANSGETLPFSTIQIRDTNIGASANVDGQFTLFDVPADTALLVVQYLG